jgi:hypothetical protein
MDSSIPNFILYGVEQNAMEDNDWFADMFLFPLQIKDTFAKAPEVERRPQRTSALQGAAFMQEVLVGHPSTCYKLFRMQRDIFVSLADVLRANYIEDTRSLSVEESLAIFCLIVSH